MDLFNTLRQQALTQEIQQKSKKIYMFNSRKSINLNHKKLNELIHLGQSFPSHNEQSIVETSAEKYLNQQLKATGMLELTNQEEATGMLRLTYKEDQDEIRFREKRRQITNQIISNFHISGYRTKKHCQNRSQNRAARSQLWGPKRCNSQSKQSHVPYNQLQTISRENNAFLVNSKTSLLPHIEKTSISIVQATFSPSRPRKLHSPLQDYSSLHEEDIYFIKTGIISGKKIQNSRASFIQNIKPQNTNNATITQINTITHNTKSSPDMWKERYYSLIRNTDYKKLTNHAGRNLIRNNFLSLKNKRNSKQYFDIDKVRGKSLIKLQEFLPSKRKGNFKI